MSQRVETAGAEGASEAADSANGVGGGALAMVQRLIFNTDATVVRILENCFDERVRTAGLAQDITQGTPSDVDLELSGGESILRRSTLLQGCQSGRNYIYAESEIVLDRLPPDVREGLLESSEPIGRLLIRGRVETFRELLRAGRALAGARGPDLGAVPGQMVPFRTYRIIVGGRPVMRITELFAPVFVSGAPHADPLEDEAIPVGGA